MGGRNVGVAVDFSSCSKAALRWASTNLARNGDKLILVHVNNSHQNEQGAIHLWEQSGSPLIPLTEFSDPHVTKTYGVSPDKETIEILTQVANQRGIEVFAKIIYGDPAKKLQEAVDLVPLNCLVIGSRGLSTLKRHPLVSIIVSCKPFGFTPRVFNGSDGKREHLYCEPRRLPRHGCEGEHVAAFCLADTASTIRVYLYGK
ncbi:hypothetical protein EJB05_31270 [Eragrostis curvula]|uniref:UspA domain-containing protein n=1 Tax=Eragrostis curvula TaxID=38414 RepID=A0A5J9UEF3_9POAL|nr:hypothetical protein EJB05_31270 [Eragrostis curvula]